jgi:hypothetical protein
MRHLLSVFLLFESFHMGVEAQEIAPVKVQLENRTVENGRHAWTTPRFRVDADAGISVEAVERMALIAESTAAAVIAYPLPLFALPEGYKPRISLYAEARAYEDAGAAKGSAGFYIGIREARVLIRADYFLNAVVVQKSRDTPKMDEDLVVHEMVHLCMHEKLSGLPQWFIDGIAEYFGSAHSGGGKFSFSRMDERVRDHLRVKLSPRDPEIRLLPVASIAALDDKGWLELMKSLPEEERYLAYGTALLLTHYHLNGGPERLGKVREILKKADQLRNPAPFLSPDDGPAIEAALIRFWRTKGLDLRFANALR